MKVLIDTNVLIDYALTRQPYADAAEKIIIMCKDKKIDGCIAAHSVMNFFFIVRKEMTIDERKDFLKYLSSFIEIVSIDSFKVANALNNNSFTDFEDCLQFECAKSFSADYIITRNIKDYSASTVTPILPDDFLDKTDHIH